MNKLVLSTVLLVLCCCAPAADRLDLKRPTAVFFWPTDDQARVITDRIGEADFNTTADDWNFYYSEAIAILKKNGIATTNISSPALVFRIGKHALRRTDGSWGAWFYDGRDRLEKMDVFDQDKIRSVR